MGGILNAAMAALPAVSAGYRMVRDVREDVRDAAWRDRSQALANERDALERERAEHARQVEAARLQEEAKRQQEEAKRLEEARERMTFEHRQALERYQLDRQQRAVMVERETEHAAQLQELDQAAGEAARLRQVQLRRVLGKARSAFGASGISAAEGSGAAVLRGLSEQAEQEQREEDGTRRLRKQTLDADLVRARQRNLLEAAQQAERQRLERFGRGYV